MHAFRRQDSRQTLTQGLAESLQIYRQLRFVDVVCAILQSVFFVPRTLIRCLRQRDRWPWADFAPYLEAPLDETRRRFGIRVAHAGRADG